MKKLNLFCYCIISLLVCFTSQTSFAINVHAGAKMLDIKNYRDTDKPCNFPYCDVVLASTCDETQGTCYSATSNSVSKFDITHQKITNLYDNKSMNNDALSLYFDKKDKLYMGTTRGVFIKNVNSDTPATFIPSFDYSMINNIFVDSQETIFAATHGQGLKIGTKQIDNTYIVKTYLENTFVRGMFVDTQGTVYVGTNRSSDVPSLFWVGKKENGLYTFTSYPIPVANEWIHCIFVDLKGVVYIGTTHGLLIGRKNTEGSYTLTNYDYSSDKNSNSVLSLYVTPQGIIYAGTEVGFFTAKEVNGDYDIVTYFDYPPVDPVITWCYPDTQAIKSIYADSQGTVYLGTSDGLSVGHLPQDSTT